MSLSEIILIAIALSMDAFAVSIAYGIAQKRMDIKGALILGLAFGSFQALMPILGFYMSCFANEYVKSIDHWVAFILLSIIGAKMVYEAISKKDEPSSISILSFYTVTILALATSIDAFAVGISFACLSDKIFAPAAIIGLVTFAFSFFGVIFGSKIGEKAGKKSELIGGLILIAIGLRIVICAL